MKAHTLDLCNNELEDTFAPARDQFEQVIHQLESGQLSQAMFSTVEEFVEQKGREVLRRLLQGYLDLRSQQEVLHDEVIGVDGIPRRQRRRNQGRDIASLFGEVIVDRTRYETRGAGSLTPLDGNLNLPKEKYSHGTSKRLAVEVARGSFDNAIEAMERNTGAHVPKRQSEQLAQRAAQDFDAFYETQQSAKKNKSGLMGLAGDAKGILVYHDDLREATRKAAQRKANNGEDTHDDDENHRCQKRMATAAAVYHIAQNYRTPEGVVERMRSPRPLRKNSSAPKPQEKRVWASIEKDSKTVVEETVQEALRRDPCQWSQWFATVDGDYTLIDTYECMKEKYNLTNLVIICDIIHVLGYLWKAANVFHPRSQRKAEQWTIKRLLDILRGRSSYVAAGMSRSATFRKLTAQKRKPVDACARYLLNHKEYLRYDDYLAKGLPISSGLIEGTVRHLINDRMAITGARWRLKTAEAVLRLRALCASDDFEVYWSFHEDQEHQRNHKTKYLGERIPDTTKEGRRRPHLQIVR